MSAADPTPELLARFRDGDAQAFAEIFRAFHRLTWRVAGRFFRDELVREEAVQEIWLTVHRNRGVVDPTRASAFPGWLLTAARNRCLDLLRARGSRGEDAEVELPPDDGLVDEAPRPEEQASAGELLGAIASFKSSLPEHLREAFELIFEQELEPAAAGRAIGASRIRMRYLKKLLLERVRAAAALQAALGRRR